MKKTLIALMALAGVAFAEETIATDYTGQFAWDSSSAPTLTFEGEFADCPLTFVLSTEAAYKTTTYLPGTFTPDVNVGNGGTWTLSFTATNESSEAITLTGMNLGLFSFNAGGATQGNDTKRTITLTLSGDLTGVKQHETVGASTGSLGTVALTLDNAVEISAGKSITFDLTVSRVTEMGTFVGLNSATVKTMQLVPEPTTATLSLLALAGLAARRRRK